MARTLQERTKMRFDAPEENSWPSLQTGALLRIAEALEASAQREIALRRELSVLRAADRKMQARLRALEAARG